jgi:hypothetical protein
VIDYYRDRISIIGEFPDLIRNLFTVDMIWKISTYAGMIAKGYSSLAAKGWIAKQNGVVLNSWRKI